MARGADRWGDDDRGDDSHDGHSGPSTVTVVLLVMGGLFVTLAAGCAGLYWYAQRQRNAALQAEQAVASREAEAARAAAGQKRATVGDAPRREEEARRAVGQQLDAARRPVADVPLPPPAPAPATPPPENPPSPARPVRPAARDPKPLPDEPPPPKPGSKPVADPPPQPSIIGFPTDLPGAATRWRVLFRSTKPALWNTNTQSAGDFALPLRSAPADTRYLRLRRMDTGDALVIPMTRDRLGRADPRGRPVRWNGEGKEEYGGYHLGIAEGPPVRWLEGKGTVGVLMDAFSANPGSGFGHAHHIENGGQRYAWQGKEIQPTAFEVAVTAEELQAAERKWLRD